EMDTLADLGHDGSHLGNLVEVPQVLLAHHLPLHATAAGGSGNFWQLFDAALVVDIDHDLALGCYKHVLICRHGFVGDFSGGFDHKPARTQSGQCALQEPTFAGRGSIEPAVMQHDEHAVLCLLDIDLDHFHAEVDGMPDRGKRVFRPAGDAALFP